VRGPFEHHLDCPAYERGDLGADCTCGQTERTKRWLVEHQAVPVRLLRTDELHEEWGLRYQNLQDEPVYISTDWPDGEASARKAKQPGDVLVRRYVTDWEEAG
jgi:hypothetical protein